MIKGKDREERGRCLTKAGREGQEKKERTERRRRLTWDKKRKGWRGERDGHQRNRVKRKGKGQRGERDQGTKERYKRKGKGQR
jgi:hypothetical protein